MKTRVGTAAAAALFGVTAVFGNVQNAHAFGVADIRMKADNQWRWHAIYISGHNLGKACARNGIESTRIKFAFYGIASSSGFRVKHPRITNLMLGRHISGARWNGQIGTPKLIWRNPYDDQFWGNGTEREITTWAIGHTVDQYRTWSRTVHTTSIQFKAVDGLCFGNFTLKFSR